LRDVVVTEYGIADLRGKSDEAVIAAMLSISDSRFQPELARQAKDAGKLARTYEIPPQFRENDPNRISTALKPLNDAGLLPPFPFGTDLDGTEQSLVGVLERLKGMKMLELLGAAASGILRASPNGNEAELLARMGLDRARSLKERFYRALLRGAGGR
jgi:hypothetical protein